MIQVQVVWEVPEKIYGLSGRMGGVGAESFAEVTQDLAV
jgi:hypothetical protein